METANVTVIGAGVVGLAVAAELSKKHKNVFLLERHDTFGMDASSRSSEVIHAGIYYEPGSLKARLCVDGNRLLYEICETYSVPHTRLGKLVVATEEEQRPLLEELFEIGRANGVHGLDIISSEEIRRMEPAVQAVGALYSPSSGIVDSHSLMKYFEGAFLANGGNIAYGCQVTAIDRQGKSAYGFKVDVEDADGKGFSFDTLVLVNSAGLESGNVAALAGIDTDAAGYGINYFKGNFFRVPAKKATLVKRLVYPVPPFPGHVGTHTVPDLAGGMKIGPLSRFVREIDYTVDKVPEGPLGGADLRETAFNDVKDFLPFIEPGDLEPDMAGIQAKVQERGGVARDFVIVREDVRGLPGLINLVGIDSPGLTAAPAIAKYVRGLADEILQA